MSPPELPPPGLKPATVGNAPLPPNGIRVEAATKTGGASSGTSPSPTPGQIATGGVAGATGARELGQPNAPTKTENFGGPAGINQGMEVRGKDIDGLGKDWEEAVRQATGGKSGRIGTEAREIDCITDKALIQAKDITTENPRNFLNKSTRRQIKRTIKLAQEQGKRAEFWFKVEPHQDIRKYIEDKGGIVKVGLGEK
jgi:hypothetical protein